MGRLLCDHVHTMPAHCENSENVTVAKFQLAFTRCRKNLKTVGNLMVRNSPQDLDAKEMRLHPKNRPVSFQKDRKMFCLHHFECSNGAVSKICRLEFRFQNLPSSKSAGKKLCHFRVNGRPIRHFFTALKCAVIV